MSKLKNLLSNNISKDFYRFEIVDQENGFTVIIKNNEIKVRFIKNIILINNNGNVDSITKSDNIYITVSKLYKKIRNIIL